MDGHESVATIRSSADLDDAARIDAIMSIPHPEDRERVQIALLLEVVGEVKQIKRERRYLYGFGHVAAVAIATIAGIFGQPLRPS